MPVVKIDGLDVLNNINAVGTLTLLDSAADPVGEGEFTRNASDTKVYVNGAVRSLADIPSSGAALANVVEDTTPQLSSALDCQSNAINNVVNASSNWTDGDLSVDTSTTGIGSVGTGVLNLSSSSDTSSGVFVTTHHNSASPADNDDILTIFIYGEDDGSTVRRFGQITSRVLDVTSTTLDSELRFTVSDNVNAGSASTTGRLISTGVWTDSSGEINKTYQGAALEIWGGRTGFVVLDKIMELRVGRFHSSRWTPDSGKPPIFHISPTAEDFWEIFGTGTNPYTSDPGLAPKDMAGVGLWGLQEMVPWTLQVARQSDYYHEQATTIFGWHEHRLNDQDLLLDTMLPDHEQRIFDLETELQHLKEAQLV